MFWGDVSNEYIKFITWRRR